MNAGPLLKKIAHALAEARLEVVLIGNAAAALQGAPVTTLCRSKRASGRPRDLAVLPVLEMTREEKQQPS